MPLPRTAQLGLLVGLVPACTTIPVDLPPPAPPVVTFDTRIRGDTATVTSLVVPQGGTVVEHRLLLNGVIVRSGPALSWTVQDTVLPSGNYMFTAEATTAGGTTQREFPFLIRETLPPTAQSPTMLGDEAGSITLNMISVTTGEPDREYTFDLPAELSLERFGASTIRVRAAATGNTPADDVHGIFALPYTVTDRYGSATGTLQFNFRPQPDITITAMRFLTGEPDTGSIRISLNGTPHDLRAGSRVQGRTGQNIWALWQQVGQASFAGLKVEGQGEEVPLNLNLLADTMSLGPDDLGAELRVLGTTYPGLDPACRTTFEQLFSYVRADTVSRVDFVVLTQPEGGRQAIEVGGVSFLRWQEAFDSLVAEEQRRAILMERAPRTFVFTTDLETERRNVGQVWVYDSIVPTVTSFIASGGSFSAGPAGDVLWGRAWATPVAPVANRRVALAKWFDRMPLIAPDIPECSRHRDTYGPEVVNPVPYANEASLVPLLQAAANWALLQRGRGYLQIR